MMKPVYEVEALTLDRGKVRRGVHRVWTRGQAMAWVACYPLDWAVAVKRFGRVVALRTLPL